MAGGSNQDTTARVVTTVAALAAAFVVHRAIAVGWKVVTGHPVPGADDDEVSTAELVTYAAISAATVAVVRVIAARKATLLIPDGDAWRVAGWLRHSPGK
jgi:hypothetical protein